MYGTSITHIYEGYKFFFFSKFDIVLTVCIFHSALRDV